MIGYPRLHILPTGDTFVHEVQKRCPCQPHWRLVWAGITPTASVVATTMGVPTQVWALFHRDSTRSTWS